MPQLKEDATTTEARNHEDDKAKPGRRAKPIHEESGRHQDDADRAKDQAPAEPPKDPATDDDDA